jgi:hypothetical protein
LSDELKVLTSGASSNQNMPVTWHGPEPELGYGLPQNYPRFRIHFDNGGNRSFPEGEFDADLQQVDLRKTNSWRLKEAK